MNAHIESFHRILEDDCLSRYEFESYATGVPGDRRVHGTLQSSPDPFQLALHAAGRVP